MFFKKFYNIVSKKNLVSEGNDLMNEEKFPKHEEKKNDVEETTNPREKGKLFAGGLTLNTTSKELENYFSQFGVVSDAVVIRCRDTGRSRGFGFVTFADPLDLANALQSFPHILNGKRIDIRRFVSGEAKSKLTSINSKIFLRGLPPDMSSETLKNFFGRYGQVVDACIPVHRNTKEPKGFGFVQFESESAAEKCLADDFVHLGGRKVFIKRAEPRNRSQVDSDTSSVYSGELVESSKTCGPLESYMENKFPGAFKMNAPGGDNQWLELLKGGLTSSNPQLTTSENDLINFYDSSESEDSSDSSDNDSANDDYEECVEDEFDVLLNKILSNRAAKAPQDSLSKAVEKECKTDSGVPSKLTIKDNKGSLLCSLCEWEPENNSFESFLLHCKTPAHKSKLKERFVKPQPRTEQSKREWEASKSAEKAQEPSSYQESFQKLTLQNQTETKKGLNKPNPESKSKNIPTTITTAAATKTKITKKGNSSVNNPSEKESESEGKEKLKNLKFMALAKGMSCIVPQANDELKCNLCNKMIPQAAEFSALMKNVSDHLLSKKHLKNLLFTEVSQVDSLEKNKKTGSQEKGSSSKQKPQQEKANSKKSTAVKTTGKQNPGQSATVTATGKQNPKHSETYKSAVNKSKFLCVPCNYRNNKSQKFKNHLKSPFHTNCFASKGLKGGVCFEYLSECVACETVLYGSMFYINKHYDKCSKSNENSSNLESLNVKSFF